MQKIKKSYLKQKISLYLDSNFPLEIVDIFRSLKSWRKKVNLRSVFDDGFETMEDPFLFDFCRKSKCVLVTRDKDFMNDQKYPFSKIPGIIRVVAGKNDLTAIQKCLIVLLDFLSKFPKPRMFMGNTKFQVSLEGCIFRGCDARTGQVKEIFVQVGDTSDKIMKFFNY